MVVLNGKYYGVANMEDKMKNGDRPEVNQVARNTEIARSMFEFCKRKIDNVVDRIPVNSVCDLHEFMDQNYPAVHKDLTVGGHFVENNLAGLKVCLLKSSQDHKKLPVIDASKVELPLPNINQLIAINYGEYHDVINKMRMNAAIQAECLEQLPLGEILKRGDFENTEPRGNHHENYLNLAALNMMVHQYRKQSHYSAIQEQTLNMKEFISTTGIAPKSLAKIMEEGNYDGKKPLSHVGSAIPELSERQSASISLPLPATQSIIDNYFPEYQKSLKKFQNIASEDKSRGKLTLFEIINRSKLAGSVERLQTTGYISRKLRTVTNSLIRQFRAHKSYHEPITLEKLLTTENFDGGKDAQFESLPKLSSAEFDQIELPLPTVQQLIARRYSEYAEGLKVMRVLYEHNRQAQTLQEILASGNFAATTNNCHNYALDRLLDKNYNTDDHLAVLNTLITEFREYEQQLTTNQPQSLQSIMARYGFSDHCLCEYILQDTDDFSSVYNVLSEFLIYGPNLIKTCLSASLMTMAVNNFLRQRIQKEISRKVATYDGLAGLVHLDILVNEALGRSLSKGVRSRFDLLDNFANMVIKLLIVAVMQKFTFVMHQQKPAGNFIFSAA